MLKVAAGLVTLSLGYGQYSKYQEYNSNQFVKASPDKNSVIVVGGGIIGITQALKLLQHNYKVTLIDSEGFPATKCSAFNGNYYSPLYYPPLITRDKMMLMVKNLFKAKETTTVQINSNVIFERNFFQFFINALLLSWTQRSFEQKLDTLYKLGLLNEKEFNPYRRLLDKNEQQQEQIVCINDEQYLKLQQDALKNNNIPNELVKINDKMLNESKYLLKLAGTNLDTRKLSQRLLQECKKFENFNVQFNQKATKFLIDGTKVVGLETDKSMFFAEKVVICTAHKSKDLLRKLKVNLPIIPGRGWVMETIGGTELIDKYQVLTPTMAVTQIGEKLRLSCGLELCQDSLCTDDWGQVFLLNEYNRLIGTTYKMEDFTCRSCLRPVTPDDVCIISKVPNHDNVFVNAGHGSRGMSFCFGAAEIMMQVIQGSKYNEYDINRYYLV